MSDEVEIMTDDKILILTPNSGTDVALLRLYNSQLLTPN